MHAKKTHKYLANSVTQPHSRYVTIKLSNAASAHIARLYFTHANNPVGNLKKTVSSLIQSKSVGLGA